MIRVVLALVVMGAAALPILWTLLTALRFEDGLTLDAFFEVLQTTPLARWLINAILISGVGTISAVLACSTAAYALRFHAFRGRGVIVAVLALTALLPAPAAIIGLFELTIRLGGINSVLAAALPSAASVFGVFVYAAAMRSVPLDRLEAARLDGASEATVWWRIVMPSVRPATSVFVLLHFLGLWNALLWPSAILISDSKQPVAVGLAEAAKSVAWEADASLPLAAMLIALLPVACLFLLTVRDLLREQ